MSIAVYDLTFLLALNVADPAQAAVVWDHIHAVATLQGVVNRSGPRLYLRYVEDGGRNIDDFWLEQLTQPGAWLAGAQQERVATLEQLVERFHADLAGAVVYDAEVAALSNLASAFAGAENLVAIRHDESPGSVFDRLVRHGPRLPVKRRLTRETIAGMNSGSDKGDAYLWGIRELIECGRCDPGYLGYYIDAWWITHATQSVANHHTLTNHDYFVAKRAYFCDLDNWGDEIPIDDPDQPLGTDRRTLIAVLAALARQRPADALLHVGGFTPWAFKYSDHDGAGGKHFGVHSEWELTRVISAYGGFLDADAIGYGAMANASFYMHFPLAAHYPQPGAHPPEEAAVEDVDRVMFYVGDYDSAAWLYQRMPELWNDPARGTVPLNWAIGPVLSRRAPMAMAWMWRTRTPGDCFIAGDNGAGYANPSILADPPDDLGGAPRLEAWRLHCARYYRQWDLRITGFLIDGLAPPSDARVLRAYADFSPDGVVCQRLEVPALRLGRMPVLRAGPDLNDADPDAAARQLLADVAQRRSEGLRHHWYRTILKSPAWHAAVAERVRRADARVRFVSAAELFSSLRAALPETKEQS